MNKTHITFSKIFVAAAFFFLTGLPFTWMHKTFLPSRIFLITGTLLIVIFATFWRDLFKFKKGLGPWIIAGLFFSSALLRKNFIPPWQFKIYDAFLIFIAFCFIYNPSGLKEMLVFTTILAAPLSLAELYGLMPSCIVSASLVGLGLIGGILLPKFTPVSLTRRKKHELHGFQDYLLLFCIAILFTLFSLILFIFPKGIIKNSKVVFDISHESTQSPQSAYSMNLDMSTSYGHGELVGFLMNHDFDIDFVYDLTQDSLKGASVLVLIMPSKPYTWDEIKSIKEFIFGGGGVLVIGDHTDIDNVASSLNPVTDQFGIRLRFDTIWLQTNDRLDLRYSPHPAIFDLEKVNFSVGASLDIRPPARPVIRSSFAVFSDYGDPNNKEHAYLGNSRFDPGEKISDLTLVAESRYGRGKIFVLGDSAFFQNTSIYQNLDFTYRVFDWLNRSKKNISYKKIGILIISSLMIILFVLVLLQGRLTLDSILAAIVSSLIVATCVGTMVNQKRFPLPEKKSSTILIDMAHQNEYGVYWTNREKLDTSLDGFVSQIIRVGYSPVIKSKGRISIDELKSHKALIIISPNLPFSYQEIESIEEFCNGGGGLLIVEGPRKWANISPLLESFGLFKERYPLSADDPILSPYGLPIRLPYGKFQTQFIPHPITKGIFNITMVNPCRVKGGQPIAFVYGEPVMSFKEFGKGRIILIGDDRFFANYITENVGQIMDLDKIRLIWNIIGYLCNE